MEEIKIDGELKVSSSMELNTYVITTKSGAYLGELSISDMAIQERVEKVFLARAKASGDIKPGDLQVKGGFKASVKIEISARL